MGLLDDLYAMLFGGGNNEPVRLDEPQPQQQYSEPSYTPMEYENLNRDLTPIDQGQWRQASPFEQAMMDIKGWGSDVTTGINKFLGVGNEKTGYRQDIIGDWANIIDFDQDDNGEVDLGEILGTVPRFGQAAMNTVKSLPGMMVEGWTEAPAYISSGLTGSRMVQEGGYDAENNLVLEGELTPEERLGSAVYGGLNVVPVGFGGVASKGLGTIAKNAGVRGFEQLGKQTAKEGAEGIIAGTTKSGINNVAKKDAIDILTERAAESGRGRAIAAGIGLRGAEQFLEEGTEEAIQEVGQNMLNDRDLSENVAESFLGGALAGGMMGGIRGAKGGMFAQSASDTEEETTGSKDLKLAAQVKYVDQFDTDVNQDGNTLIAAEREAEAALQEFTKRPGSSSGMGLAINNNQGVDSCSLGIENILRMLSTENASNSRTKRGNEFFNNLEVAKNAGGFVRAWEEAMTSGGSAVTEFMNNVNAEISALQSSGQSLDVFVGKNPGNVQGVVRNTLGGVNFFGQRSSVGVSSLTAIELGADFDSDKYLAFFDDGSFDGVDYASMRAFSSSQMYEISDIAHALNITSNEDIEKFASMMSFAYKEMVPEKSRKGRNSISDRKFGLIAAFILTKNLHSSEMSKWLGEHKDKTEYDWFVEYASENGMNVAIGSLGTKGEEYSSSLKRLIEENDVDTWFKLLSNTSYKIDDKYKPAFAASINNVYAEFYNKFKSGDRFSSAIDEAEKQVNSDKEVESAKKNGIDPKMNDDGTVSLYGDDVGVVPANCPTAIAFMMTFSRRLFVNPSMSDAVCRESLAAYFTVKSRIFELTDGFTKDVSDDTLVSVLAKTDLGIAAYAEHPVDLLSSYVFNSAYESAIEDMKPNITSKEDLNDFKKKFRSEYNSKRNAAKEAIASIVKDEGIKLDSAMSGLSIPEWTDQNDDSMFYKAISGMKLASLVGKENIAEGMRHATVGEIVGRARIEGLREQGLLMDQLFEGVNIPGIKTFVNEEILRKCLAADVSSLIDSSKYGINSIETLFSDSGFQSFLSSVRNKEKAEDLTADERITLNNYMQFLCGRAGRKDFLDIGLTKDIMIFDEKFSDLRNDFFSGNFHDVVNRLETLSIQRKTSKLYNAIIEYAKSPVKTKSQKETIVYELDDIRRYSPLYCAISDWISQRIFDKDGKTLIDSEILGMAKENSWFEKFVNPKDANQIADRDRTIDLFCGMAAYSDIIDSRAKFALLLEDAVDPTSLESMSSRTRNYSIYATRAVDSTAAAISSRVQSFKNAIPSSADDKYKMKLLRALELRTISSLNSIDEFAVGGLVMSGYEYSKSRKDKTNRYAESEALLIKRAIADLGYIPNTFGNLFKGEISSDMLSGNPAFAQRLLLTSYIEDVGGIDYRNGNKIRHINNREELYSILLGHEVHGELSLDHVVELLDKYPSMINFVQPISTSFFDMNGGLITRSNVKSGYDLKSISDEISNGMSGANWRNEYEKSVRQSKLVAEMFKTPAGSEFFLATLLGTHPEFSHVDPTVKQKIVSDHLSTMAEFLDVYRSAPIEVRNNMKDAIIRRSANRGLKSFQDSVMLDESKIKYLSETMENLAENQKESVETLRFIMMMLSKTKMSDEAKNAIAFSLGLNDDEKKILDANKEMIKLFESDKEGSVQIPRNATGVSVLVKAIGYLNLSSSSLDSVSNVIRDEKIARDAKIRKINAVIDSIRDSESINDDEKTNIIEELEKSNKFLGLETFSVFLNSDVENGNRNYETIDQLAKNIAKSIKNDELFSEIIKQLAKLDTLRHDSGSEYGNELDPSSWAGNTQRKRDLLGKLLGRAAESIKEENVATFVGSPNLTYTGYTASVIDNFFNELDPEEVTRGYGQRSYSDDENINSFKFAIDFSDSSIIEAMGVSLFNFNTGNVSLGTSVEANARKNEAIFEFYQDNTIPFDNADQCFSEVSSERLGEYIDMLDSMEDPTATELLNGYEMRDGKIHPVNASRIRRYAKKQGATFNLSLPCMTSAGFDAYKLPPSKMPGQRRNFFTEILSMVYNLGAEGVNLKAKKNIGSFDETNMVLNADKETISRKTSQLQQLQVSQDPESVAEAVVSMVESVRGEWIEEARKILKQNNRKEIKLNYAHLKVLSDHTIRQCILTLDDGSNVTVSMSDVMSKPPMIDPAICGRIKSAYIVVENPETIGVDMGNECFAKVAKSTGGKNVFGDRKAWSGEFQNLVKNRRVEAYDDMSSLAGDIALDFATAGSVGYGTGRSLFFKETNSMLEYKKMTSAAREEVSSKEGKFSDAYFSFNESFCRQEGLFVGNNQYPTIVQTYYVGGKPDVVGENLNSKVSDYRGGNYSGESTAVILKIKNNPEVDEVKENFTTILTEARHAGVAHIFVKADRNNAGMINVVDEAANDYILNGHPYLRIRRAKTNLNGFTEYMIDEVPRADYTTGFVSSRRVYNRGTYQTIFLNDEVVMPDGSEKYTKYGLGRLDDMKMVRQIREELNTAMFGGQRTVISSPLSTEEIGNIDSDEMFKYLESMFKQADRNLTGSALTAYISRVKSAWNIFVAQQSEENSPFYDNGVWRNGSNAPNDADIMIVGVVKATIGSSRDEVYIPLILDNVAGGETIDIIEGSNGSFTVERVCDLAKVKDNNIKTFNTVFAYKATRSSGEFVSDGHISYEGGAVDIDIMSDKYWNGGKFEPFEFKKKEYVKAIKEFGLTAFFKKVDGSDENNPQYELNKDVFSGWSTDQIADFFGVDGKDKQRSIYSKIESGDLSLTIGSDIGTSTSLQTTISKIAGNCIAYKIDMATMLSDVVLDIKNVDTDALNDFVNGKNTDNGILSIGCPYKRAEDFFDPMLLFNEIESEEKFQNLFNAIAPEYFAKFNDIENRAGAMYDAFGKCSCEIDGKNVSGYLLITDPQSVRYDDTQSVLQSAADNAAVGPKIMESTIFSNGYGEREINLLEMANGAGYSSSVSQYVKQRKRFEKDKSKTPDLYAAPRVQMIPSDRVVYEQVARKEYDDLYKEIGKTVVPFADSEFNKVKPGPNDVYEYSDPVLEDMRQRMARTLGIDLAKLIPNMFNKICVYGFSYTKSDSGSDVKFTVDDVDMLAQKIMESLKENNSVFDGRATVSRRNFSRYGLPTIDKDLATFFYEQNVANIQDRVDSANKLQEIGSKHYNDLLNTMRNEPIAKRRAISDMARAVALNNSDNMDLPNVLQDAFGIPILKVIDKMAEYDMAMFDKRYSGMVTSETLNDIRENIQNIERRRQYRAAHAVKTTNGDVVYDSLIGNVSFDKIVDTLISLKATMSVATPMLLPASVADRFVYGNTMRYLMINALHDKKGVKHHFGFDSKISDVWDDAQINDFIEQSKSASKTPQAYSAWGALRTLSMMTDFDINLDEAIKHPGGVTGYINDRISKGGLPKRMQNAMFRYASGFDIGSNIQIQTFIFTVVRLISLDDSLRERYLTGTDNQIPIIRQWMREPDMFIAQVFDPMNGLTSIGKKAMNAALRGDAAQRSVASTLIHEYCSQYKVGDFFTKTFISPFVQYGINISGRHMNALLPVSTFNYVLTKFLANSQATILGLNTVDENGNPVKMKWSDLNLEDTQICESLRDALILDVAHMGPVWAAALIVGLGCLEPPDDDDEEKWCNVDEWTFCGQRISMNWWIRDAVGPTLGIACMLKSSALGKPNLAVMWKDMAECIYSNPVIRASDLVDNLIDPYSSYMESYYEDCDRFDNARDGQFSAIDVASANLGTGLMNWATGFIMPSFVRELYANSNQYEVSYKKIFEENETGQLTEDGLAGKTMYTTYFDQRLRLLTRKNPYIAAIADLLSDSGTGYFASEMPRTVYYNPDQMDCYQNLSLYTTDEYGNKVAKSDQECQEIAMSIILMLQQYDNMDELRKTGFCMPYDTMKYTGDVIMSIAAGYDDIFKTAATDGTFDYYRLGGGDEEYGENLANAYQQLYTQSTSYWKSMYYDKLWSDQMKAGIEEYNRYNTTYETDANGNYYATGFRKNYAAPFSPFLSAPGSIGDPDGTSGYDAEGNDWSTISALTGNTTNERALIPFVKKVKTPEWEPSSSYPSAWSYGARSYGGYGYGGYGYGGGSYSSRPASFSYKIPTNTYNYVRPYGENLSTPKANTTPYKYGKDLADFSFSTKGSRDAYKRGDI